MNDTILIWLPIILCVIIIIGFLASWKTGNSAFLALVTALAGTITFFGMLLLPIDSEASNGFSESTFRIAITVTIVIVYILLIAGTAFTTTVPQNFKSNPIAEKLIVNFGYVIVFILAFYFGTSAYVEIQIHNNYPSSEVEAVKKQK